MKGPGISGAGMYVVLGWEGFGLKGVTSTKVGGERVVREEAAR